MDTKRLEKEKAFHDVQYGEVNVRKNAGKYYSVTYHLNDRYNELIAKHSDGKKLLEYGCGKGSGSKQWLEYGAILTGIDISPEGIKIAKEAISKTEYDADYFVMDAEETDFDDNTFDIVVGTGIIHHLDVLKSYQELSRILKEDGRIVFSEPLGHNPFINLYRNLTPKMRTEDEHPLMQKDLDLLKQYFNTIETEYFILFSLLAVPFRKTFFFNMLYKFLISFDKLVFHIPFLRKYAWMVILHASNPKR